MNKPTVFLLAALSLSVASTGCTGSGVGSNASTSTAPLPSTDSSAPPSVAPPTTVTVTSTTASTTTVPVTTAPATTVQPTTRPGTSVLATNPTGVPAAVTGDPMLTDIPGRLIDYVPGVAANLDIDVPGQYYEILPKFYVFIPTQDSAANANLRTPTPEQVPAIEAYVRAIGSLWGAFTMNPVPATGTPEMEAAFVPEAYEIQKENLAVGAIRRSTTRIRSGNGFVPLVSGDGVVTDCAWIDQVDEDSNGTIYENLHTRFGLSATLVSAGDGLKASSLYEDQAACAE